jgi:hypothetical protein
MAAAATAAVLVACSTGRGAAGDPADSLALLYSFDARSGDVVRDFSGRAHHGTVFGATWVAGRHGGGLSFDGVDDYVQAVGYYPFSDANGLTVEAWVKLTGRRAYTNIASSRTCCNYRMLISPDLHPFYDPGAYADFQVTSYSFEVGKWTHYALVVAGGQSARVLIDGKVVSDTDSGVPDVLPSFYEAMMIGGDPDYPHNMEGMIDEMRIYTRALSDHDIRADMTSSTTAFLVQRAENLVSGLARKGGDSSAAAERLRESREALNRNEDETAQDRAYAAASLAQAELVKQEGRRGATTDASSVLLATLVGIFALGALLAGVLIWGAWKSSA